MADGLQQFEAVRHRFNLALVTSGENSNTQFSLDKTFQSLGEMLILLNVTSVLGPNQPFRWTDRLADFENKRRSVLCLIWRRLAVRQDRGREEIVSFLGVNEESGHASAPCSQALSTLSGRATVHKSRIMEQV